MGYEKKDGMEQKNSPQFLDKKTPHSMFKKSGNFQEPNQAGLSIGFPRGLDMGDLQQPWKCTQEHYSGFFQDVHHKMMHAGAQCTCNGRHAEWWGAEVEPHSPLLSFLPVSYTRLFLFLHSLPVFSTLLFLLLLSLLSCFLHF